MDFKIGDKIYIVVDYFGIYQKEIDLIRNNGNKYGLKGTDFMYSGEDFIKSKEEAVEILNKNITKQKDKLYNNYINDVKKLDGYLSDTLLRLENFNP